MRRRRLPRSLIALSVAGLVWLQPSTPPAALAAPDPACKCGLFLRVDGIVGASTDRKFQGSIEIDSFAWKVSTPGGGTDGRTVGRVQAGEFTFETAPSKASPKLLEFALTGARIPNVVLTARSVDTATEYMVFTFNDVGVTSFETQNAMKDRFGLTFTRFRYDYTEVTAKGTTPTKVSAGWDFSKNAKA